MPLSSARRRMPGARVERGESVALRTVEPEDAALLQRGSANPALRYPMGTAIETRDAFESKIEETADDDDAQWFLVCREGDDAPPGPPDDADDVEPVGMVSVRGLTWRRPELGYWIAPEYQGEGYGGEAVALAVDTVFRTNETPAVEAAAYADNDASCGLLESLGFEREGRLRKHRFVDGRYRDVVVYGLLREEWEGRDD